MVAAMGQRHTSSQVCGRRALAQTIFASCSEQAWSEYDFVHSRRRNALKKGYASMLVRGHNYARLIRRLKKVDYKPSRIAWTDSEDESESE